jgi:hypothetical protein
MKLAEKYVAKTVLQKFINNWSIENKWQKYVNK